jgi:hypothetical protein
MKQLAWLAGLAGMLAAAMAVCGRFRGPPTISLLGQQFAAGSVLLVANTLILIGILLAVAGRPRD